MEIAERIPLVEEILGAWAGALGEDRRAYTNHVYRVIHFCLAAREASGEERERVVVAACFHDLGIWTADTFDYLDPSIALAREYLERRGLDAWSAQVERMIDLHHKLRPVRDPRFPWVEAFRRADLVDLSLGAVRFGLPRSAVREVRRRFPNAGLHRLLIRRAGRWFLWRPWNPVPVLKW